MATVARVVHGTPVRAVSYGGAHFRSETMLSYEWVTVRRVRYETRLDEDILPGLLSLIFMTPTRALFFLVSLVTCTFKQRPQQA